MVLRDRADLRDTVRDARPDPAPGNVQVRRPGLGRREGRPSPQQAASGIRLLGIEPDRAVELPTARGDELGEPAVIGMAQRVAGYEHGVGAGHGLPYVPPDLIVGAAPSVGLVTVGKPLRSNTDDRAGASVLLAAPPRRGCGRGESARGVPLGRGALCVRIVREHGHDDDVAAEERLAPQEAAEREHGVVEMRGQNG